MPAQRPAATRTRDGAMEGAWLRLRSIAERAADTGLLGCAELWAWTDPDIHNREA